MIKPAPATRRAKPPTKYNMSFESSEPLFAMTVSFTGLPNREL